MQIGQTQANKNKLKLKFYQKQKFEIGFQDLYMD